MNNPGMKKLLVVIGIVLVLCIIAAQSIKCGGSSQTVSEVEHPTAVPNTVSTAAAERVKTATAAGEVTSVPQPPVGSPVAPPTQTTAPVVVRVGFPTATATQTATPTATPTKSVPPAGRGTVAATRTVTPTISAVVIADFPPLPTDDDQSLIAIMGTTSRLDWEGIGFVWGRTCLKGCIARAEAREFPSGVLVLVPNMNLEVISGTLKYEGVSFSGSAVIQDKLDHNWVKVTDLTLEPTGPKKESIPTSQVITTLGKQTIRLGGGYDYRMLVVSNVLVENTGEGVIRLTLKDAWWILLPEGEGKDKILGKINQIPPPDPTPAPTATKPAAVKSPTRTPTPGR